MPIERGSDAWADGAEGPMLEAQVVDFLSSNAEKAFTLRELANAVGFADWDKAKQWAEDYDRMDIDDFQEKYPNTGNHPAPRDAQHATEDFYMTIRSLAQKEIIDVREVNVDAFDDGYILPDEGIETITTVAYAADA